VSFDVASIEFKQVTKRYKDGTVAVSELDLAIPHGEFMILVGPSGCGKTTALRMVAGLEDISAGEILLGDQVANDIEPADRDVAMIFQNYALFPHMSVYDNMAFPLRMRGFKKPEVMRAVDDAAEMLGLGKLLRRKPSQLSGGQRQRVAMGRAIVRHPAVFLMDEPLSNLDAKLRTQMRTELARMHQHLGVTTIYVTHDQTEAMTLGSRIAVMRDGVVQQAGSPHELFHRPANSFVASFLGSPPMNLVRGRIADGALEVKGASHPSRVDGRPGWPGEPRDVLVGVRPDAWRIDGHEDPSERITIDGEVEVVEDLGSEAMIYFRSAAIIAGADSDSPVEKEDVLVARVAGVMRSSPGERIKFHAELNAVHLFDAHTGEALLAPDDSMSRNGLGAALGGPPQVELEH